MENWIPEDEDGDVEDEDKDKDKDKDPNKVSDFSIQGAKEGSEIETLL